MNSNLADLPLDLPPDLPPSVLTSSGQDEFKFGRSIPLLLTYSGQDEFKFGTSTLDWLQIYPPWYLHLVIK